MVHQCSFIQRIRQYRIAKMAIFDWSATIIPLFILSWLMYYKWNIANNLPFTFILFIVILIGIISGIIIHKILNVPTMLNYYLGISEKPKKSVCFK
jgi:hypothetical protein